MEPDPPLLPAEPSVVSGTSLGARLFNVFATPGDVFDEVRDSAAHVANWLVPLLLACLVGAASSWVILSQPTILHQIREQQAAAMDKKLRDLPAEQQEQIRAATERFTSPALLKLFGLGGAIVGPCVWLFLIALFVWLLGRLVFRADFAYVKALEACGLAGMIGVLGAILTTLLIVSLGQLAVTPGPAAFIRNFDPSNKLHLTLAACNVVTLWYIATLAVGLARLSRSSFVQALLCLLVPWAVFRFGLIALGVGAQ